jgi:hypothetical protein
MKSYRRTEGDIPLNNERLSDRNGGAFACYVRDKSVEYVIHEVLIDY